MAKKWRDLYNKLPAERRAKIEADVRAMQREMPLHELRRARELSQQTLAELLGESQPAVSQLEQRTDMYVSTLRRYIEAMGGRLDIVAHFPDGDVRITQFADTAA
jgi:DNA-binding XRE family transcriptional regulator